MSDTVAQPTIGFIGLGNMGAGMARNLLKAGFSLVVSDLRVEAAEPLLAAGARWAGSAAEAARLSDVVITMLPTPSHVATAATGPNGILSGISDGATWIDMSTSVPEVLETIRREFAEKRLCIVDAPVSGMSVGATNGTLQIFIGADDADVARLRPIFEAMGDPNRIIHVGPPGTGYVAKLMINQLWFAHLVASAEVFAVAAAAGVDLGVMRRALVASPANSHFIERDVLSIFNHGDYDEGFSIALSCKDLRLSRLLAESVGVSAELGRLVENVFASAREKYGDLAGEMTPFKLYEDQVGRDLRLEVQLESL